ncbi:hypothetical protein Vadar_016952 [Vaccinium darrowii]|uniref:Uncharacterized protein n=1 Tax=Vaccinium darrowii TaxID=229202 RepID=A0ACB7ZKD2_9ERIC|nr:hypothetical protein Vadar_016952 [Vaccinium darrowii]
MVENIRRPSREEASGKLDAALRLQSLEWPPDKKPQAFKLNWLVIVYDVMMLVTTNFNAVFSEVVYVVLTNVKAIKVIKDVSSGLMLGLGKKTYASYVTRGVLMFRAKQWYQDEVPNWKKIYAEKAMEERAELPPLPEKLKSKTKLVQMAYMLFALGCLLCPTMKDVVGSRLFPAVYDDDNMDTMKTYKWPAFMLDWLANEIQNYKDRESKQHPCQGKGVGGSLFILMIIYFDRFPLTVDIAKESVLPNAAWTKELIDERIRLEPEDKPSKESVLSKFPPHNMKIPGFIQAYEDLVYNFKRNAKNLRKLDAEWSAREEVMNRTLVRGTTSSPKEDGPSDFNLTPKEAVVDERPEFSSFIEENEVNVGGDNVTKESHTSFRNIYGRRTKGAATSTHPSKRRGVRPLKKGQSTQPPYVAAPPFKVMHTVRDWLMMKENKDRPSKKLQPRRHIFHPDFAINLLKAKSGKFNKALMDEDDLDKHEDDFMKCDLV